MILMPDIESCRLDLWSVRKSQEVSVMDLRALVRPRLASFTSVQNAKSCTVLLFGSGFVLQKESVSDDCRRFCGVLPCVGTTSMGLGNTVPCVHDSDTS